MEGEYQGILAVADPLYPFLAEQVLQEILGAAVQQPLFDIYQMDGDGVVYGYRERCTGIELLGKFYGNRVFDGNGMMDRERTAELMHREYQNLCQVWALGLNAPPHRVVRPLAVSEPLNCVLVEEYVSGPNLDVFLKEALQQDRYEALDERLGDLAAFLATLHNRSQSERPVDSGQGLNYLAKVIDQLAAGDVIDDAGRDRLEALRSRWAATGVLETATEVLVHGDVTPVNIVFGDDHQVIAIDLERLHTSDAALDLGCALAEIHHTFLLHGKDAAASTPLGERFLDRYITHRQQSQATLSTLRERSRFFKGSMMLRICRNEWLDLNYRRILLAEAEQWLQA